MPRIFFHEYQTGICAPEVYSAPATRRQARPITQQSNHQEHEAMSEPSNTRTAESPQPQGQGQAQQPAPQQGSAPAGSTGAPVVDVNVNVGQQPAAAQGTADQNAPAKTVTEQAAPAKVVTEHAPQAGTAGISEVLAAATAGKRIKPE